jgi:hypothetical protein
MGGSVLNGAMSTFVAVALLGLSDSFVFRSMFNLFLFRYCYFRTESSLTEPMLLTEFALTCTGVFLLNSLLTVLIFFTH